MELYRGYLLKLPNYVYAVLYALAYVTLLLLSSVVIFRRREFL
jgi:hypothetical protein